MVLGFRDYVSIFGGVLARCDSAGDVAHPHTRGHVRLGYNGGHTGIAVEGRPPLVGDATGVQGPAVER